MASLLESRRVSVVALAVGLALASVGPGYGTSVEIQLTPTNTNVNGLAFKVEARDMGDSNEVEVIVAAAAGRELSPFLSAHLEVHEGERLVLSCPVEKKEQDGELRYQFHVSARDVSKVRFSFEEYAFVKLADKDGSVKFVPMPSLNGYWLNLEDFVVGKVEPVSPVNKARTLLIGLLVVGVGFYAAMYRNKGKTATKELPT